MPTVLFSFCLIFLFFLDKRFNYKLAISLLVTIIIGINNSILILKLKNIMVDRTLEQVGIYEMTDWGEGHENFWTLMGCSLFNIN